MARNDSFSVAKRKKLDKSKRPGNGLKPDEAVPIVKGLGAEKEHSISKIARKNIGSIKNFKTISDYRVALREERKRLREANNMKLIGATFQPQYEGRKAEFRKEFVDAARVVCSVYGSSVEELAKFFDVEPGKIRHWMKEYPAFHLAVTDRATEINMQIMGRLARRALGFYAKTEKVFYDVKRGEVVRVDTKEYYPPSEAAIMFWLKNRMPEQWKDVKDVNVDENRRITMEIYKNFDTLNSEQASDAYQELLKIEGATPPQVQSEGGSKTRHKVTDADYTERDPKAGTDSV